MYGRGDEDKTPALECFGCRAYSHAPLLKKEVQVMPSEWKGHELYERLSENGVSLVRCLRCKVKYPSEIRPEHVTRCEGNPATVEALLKLAGVKTMQDFGALLKFCEENELVLYSRRGTRTSGRRRAFMFDKHPSNPTRRVTYLYDDGATSGDCLLKNLYRVFTIVEERIGGHTGAGEWKTFC